MASLKDVQKLTDSLEGLVGELRNELKNGAVDFERLIEISDQISEQADGAASTFATVNETLMNRIKEIGGGGSSGQGSSSSRSTQKAGSKS